MRLSVAELVCGDLPEQSDGQGRFRSVSSLLKRVSGAGGAAQLLAFSKLLLGAGAEPKESPVPRPPRVTFGFLLTPTDLLLEQDLKPVLAQLPNVLGRAFRMQFTSPEINAETFRQSRGTVYETAAAIEPGEGAGSVDVLVLSCTSMSMVLGPDFVESEMLRGYPAASASITMARSVLNALFSVRASLGLAGGQTLRVALLTPYATALHRGVLQFLQAQPWLEVVADGHMNASTDEDITALDPDYVKGRLEGVVHDAADRGRVDVALAQCSALRVTSQGWIDTAEAALEGVTVVTSHQAMFWDVLHCAARLGKLQVSEVRAVRGYGGLFARPHHSAPREHSGAAPEEPGPELPRDAGRATAKGAAAEVLAGVATN